MQKEARNCTGTEGELHKNNNTGSSIMWMWEYMYVCMYTHIYTDGRDVQLELQQLTACKCKCNVTESWHARGKRGSKDGGVRCEEAIKGTTNRLRLCQDALVATPRNGNVNRECQTEWQRSLASLSLSLQHSALSSNWGAGSVKHNGIQVNAEGKGLARELIRVNSLIIITIILKRKREKSRREKRSSGSGSVHTELSVAIWAWARARSRHGSSRRICFRHYFVRFFVVVAVSFYEEPKWKRLTSDVETFSTQQRQQQQQLPLLLQLQQPRPRESSDETATHLLT